MDEEGSCSVGDSSREASGSVVSKHRPGWSEWRVNNVTRKHVAGRGNCDCESSERGA